ncbi:MAG: hypothetical protein WBC40_06370 [Halobacteriota archaeon]
MQRANKTGGVSAYFPDGVNKAGSEHGEMDSHTGGSERGLQGMFNSVFQAFEKMEYVSVGRILSSALMLGGALFAISHGFSVVGFASIYFIVSAVGLGYSFVVCAWKFAKPKVEVDWSFWKPTMKEALPFG